MGGRKSSIFLPNSQTLSGHNGRPILASQQMPGTQCIKSAAHYVWSNLSLWRRKQMPKVNSTALQSTSGQQSICHSFSKPACVWRAAQSHRIVLIPTQNRPTKARQSWQIIYLTHKSHIKFPVSPSQTSSLIIICVTALPAVGKRSLQNIFKGFKSREMYSRQVQALTAILYH